MDRRTRFPTTTPRLLALTAAVLLVAGACTTDDGWRAEQHRGQLRSATEISALRAVDGCDALAEAARPALEQSIEWAWGAVEDEVAAFDASGDEQLSVAESSGGTAADSAEASPPATTAAPTQDGAASLRATGAGEDAQPAGAIGTNNQEQGVEESDLFVTNGELMVWVVGGVLRVAQNDDQVDIDGTLDLSPRSPTELFLRGDRALVMGTTFGMVGPVGPVVDGPVLGDPGVARSDPGGIAPADAIEQSSEPAEPGTTPTTTEPDEPTPTLPTTTLPTTTLPDTTAPATTVPETTIPDTTVPATTIVEPPPVEPPPFPVATTLTLVSLEDPANPAVLASADVEGELVSARQVDGTTRIVIRSSPAATLEPLAAPNRAAAVEALESVGGGDLLPRMAIDDEVTAIGGCGDVFVTSAVNASTSDERNVTSSFAPEPGLSTVTVLSVGDDLDDLAPVSLQGAADTVYASTEALYVASGSWDQEGSRTDVHRFSMPAAGPVTYSGSGRVPGRLLNQFSMSERDGALRVVTTTDGTASGGSDVPTPEFPDGDRPTTDMVMPSFATEARLTVLDTDGTLDELGWVDGLGVGEEVQSVRFIGDLGYVVTFRQTDPLYALDLSDPRNPTVLGELKITGFSEYMHPVGEDLLLGVGREADPDTGFDEGFKVSLFDISDPTELTEVDKIVMPGTWSEVSQTHKAFTWDAERSQAIIPIDTSALVIGVDGATLEQRGSIIHDTQRGPTAPRRSRVVADQIWTVSDAALGITPAASPGATSVLAH